MATIGLKDLYYATVTEGEQGAETYGTPEKLAAAISAELSVEASEATLYADDMLMDSVKEFASGTLTLGVDDLPPEKLAALLGQTLDTNKVAYAGGDDTAPYVAIGFRARKANGQYRYIWLYKVKFSPPGESYNTKGDSIEFQTPEIEGQIMTRADGLWKADYVGQEDDEVAEAWFDQVREPNTTPAA